MMKQFRVVSTNISSAKGTVKKPVVSINLKTGVGVVGDAHAGPGDRQVSLLASEDIEATRIKGADIVNGSFAENITTRGIDLAALPVGTRLNIGSAALEISQIGKQCHRECEIMRQAGDCIMPRRGVFAVVIAEGEVCRGDTGTYDI